MRYIATIGTFDGVHLGHRHLLGQLKAEAMSRGMKPLAVTFTSHPLSAIRPEMIPPALSTPEERIADIQALGIDTLALDFTQELRRLTAAEFLTMLRRRHQVHVVMPGFNNRIGSDRIHGIDQYTDAGIRAGVEILPASSRRPGPEISSSTIRKAIALGDMDEAAEMLGHPYRITGTVVHGQAIGRTIGFPTANILTPADIAIPGPGVYAADTADGHRAVVNIGTRPTVTDGNPAPATTIEAHLLDFNGNLYGSTLTLSFIRRLRDERKFSSIDDLKRAIQADTVSARLI